MIENFNKWEDIDEIIHLGAISSTTETKPEQITSLQCKSNPDAFSKKFG